MLSSLYLKHDYLFYKMQDESKSEGVGEGRRISKLTTRYTHKKNALENIEEKHLILYTC